MISTVVQLSKQIVIDHEALAKQGDNRFDSIYARLFVCLSILASCSGNDTTSTCPSNLCVIRGRSAFIAMMGYRRLG